jgi:hypothetical protein
MDQNGSKTRKLRIKQGYRGLYAISYRLQGLAEKKYKTQKIGLTNTEKIRVRSEKFHGGARLKRWNRFRGFSAIFARYRKEQENYIFLQGLNCEKLGTASHGGRQPLFLKFPSILATRERGK